MVSMLVAVVTVWVGLRCSNSGSGVDFPVALRVSRKTFSNWDWKSFSAASASASVMSPRPTSASV